MDVRFEEVRLVRGGREVLNVPSVHFATGHVTALVGPNGAGKSSTLRLIAGLERPAAGRLLLGETPVRPGTTSEAVSYAFQSAIFLAGTVRQNIEVALRFRRVPAESRPKRLHEAAAACGIEGLLDRDARRLSGGEAQRANLARALALRAPITLLDEPLAGLDAPARRQLLHDLPRLLREFATTAVVVTHDRDEALRLADDLVVLIDGNVHAQGPRAQVFGRPPDAATARFLGYTLVELETCTVGIAPRALRAGPGEVTFHLAVDEVLDLGVRREVWGTIGGVQASVSLPPAGDDVPAVLQVSAPASAVHRYDRSGLREETGEPEAAY